MHSAILCKLYVNMVWNFKNIVKVENCYEYAIIVWGNRALHHEVTGV